MHVLFVCVLVLLSLTRDAAATSCKTCQSPPSDDIPLCRCDDQCRVYGDCCPDVSVDSPPVISDSITAVISYMECQSRYRSLLPLSVGDAYYMVSSCPHSNWTQDEQYATSIANNCTSPEFIEFPPVSDPSSGITYRNEFCAICHNVDSSTLLTWSSRLVCDPDFKNISQTQNVTLDLIQQYCPRCSFDPPINSIVMDTLRWCLPVESTCPPFTQFSIYNETEYEQIVDSCANGDYNPIHEAPFFLPPNIPFTKIYRNLDCFRCALTPDFLKCIYPAQDNSTVRCLDFTGQQIIGAAPFSVLLDVTGSGVVSIMSSQITEVEVIRCGENQVFDPVQGCRDIVCPNGLTPIAGTCVLESSVTATPPLVNATINETDGNNTVSMNTTINVTTIEPSLPYSINCTPIALDHDEYTISDDNTSVIFRGEVLDIVGYDNNGRPLVCVVFGNTGNITRNSTITRLFYPPGLAEISYACVLLSIIASSLILITYSIFSEFRTLPSKLLMNMAVAFLIGDIILLLSNITSLYIDLIELCVTISILQHFFFLARFSWMNCMGAEYVRTFYKAFRLSATARNNAISQNKRVVCYMMIGWGVPLVITIVTIVVNFTVEGSVRYGTDTDGEQGLCWINNRNAIIIAFVTPVFLATVLNLIAFVVIVLLLWCASRQMRNDLQNRQKAAQARVAVGMFLVLGVTWVFGFIALLTNQSWAWYPFVILNSNQAVFIAICFLATKKVMLKYWSLIKFKVAKPYAGRSMKTYSPETEMEKL